MLPSSSVPHPTIPWRCLRAAVCRQPRCPGSRIHLPISRNSARVRISRVVLGEVPSSGVLNVGVQSSEPLRELMLLAGACNHSAPLRIRTRSLLRQLLGVMAITCSGCVTALEQNVCQPTGPEPESHAYLQKCRISD